MKATVIDWLKGKPVDLRAYGAKESVHIFPHGIQYIRKIMNEL